MGRRRWVRTVRTLSGIAFGSGQDIINVRVASPAQEQHLKLGLGLGATGGHNLPGSHDGNLMPRGVSPVLLAAIDQAWPWGQCPSRSTHSRHSNAARSVGPWLTGLQDRLSRPRSHRRIGWRGEPSAFACLRIWPGGSFGFVRVRALEISILPTPKFVRLVTVRSRHRCRNLFACSSTWANHKHEVVAELCEVGVCEYRLPYTSLLSTFGVSLRSGCLLGI